MKPSFANLVGPVLALIILGSLFAWLYPTAKPPRRHLPTPVAPVAQVDKNSRTDTSYPSEPRPISDEGILELLEAYSLPADLRTAGGDADPAHPRTGSEDAVLRQEPEAVAEQVLARGPALIGRGSDRGRLYFNLGRLALAQGDKEAAKRFLETAADAHSVGAKAYLTQFDGEPIEKLAALDQAVRAGFTPAVAMRKNLEATFADELDNSLLDPNDPQKPRDPTNPQKLSFKVGKTNDWIQHNLEPERLEYFIRNYGEWAKAQTNTPRLTFEIGRGAYWLGDNAHAEEYLGFAANLKSPAALAYLTLLPKNADQFDQNIERLQIALNGKYSPAAQWLQEAKPGVYDPKHFIGANDVMNAMIHRQAGTLWSGSVFFDNVDVGGLSRELFIRPMLLEYISAFAGYYEGAEPAYLGSGELAASMVRAGSAEIGRRKVNETFAGLIMNNNWGGSILSIQKFLEGSYGPALRALQPDGGLDASLKQRREQVKQMGETHARTLLLMAKHGNESPMRNAYATAVEFIERAK